MGSNNCGICTSNTTVTNTFATCTDMSIDGRVCNLSILTESEDCDLLRGTISDPVYIILKGIDSLLTFACIAILYIYYIV